MQKSLKARFIDAALKVLTGSLLQQIIRFIGNLVLTRLLVPEHFGLMAVANAFLVGAALLTDSGIHGKIMNSPRVSERVYVNTVWTVQAIRGLLITLLLLMLSAALWHVAVHGIATSGSVYASPELGLVLAALSATALLQGFVSPGVHIAKRELRLGRVVMYQLIGQLVSLVTMLLIAWWHPSVWALVIGTLVGATATLGLSHGLLPYRGLRFALERAALGDIYHYAKWVLLSSALTFAAQTADRMLLALYVTAASMGKYSLAYFLVEALRQLIGSVMSSASTGALAEVARERPQNLRSVYFKLRLPFDLLLGVSAGGLFVLAPMIIQILYDDRYALAGEYLRWLSLIIPVVRYQQVGPMLVALNRPRLMPVLTAFSALGVALFIPFGASLGGEMGAVIGVVAAYYLRIPAIWWVQWRFGCLSWWRELQIFPLIILGFGLGKGALLALDMLLA